MKRAQLWILFVATFLLTACAMLPLGSVRIESAALVKPNSLDDRQLNGRDLPALERYLALVRWQPYKFSGLIDRRHPPPYSLECTGRRANGSEIWTAISLDKEFVPIGVKRTNAAEFAALRLECQRLSRSK